MTQEYIESPHRETIPAPGFWSRGAFILFVLVLSAGAWHCTLVDIENVRRERSPLFEVETFAVYSSGPVYPALGCYDLAILDPDGINKNKVTQLDTTGTVPIAYLNIGEFETYRWFASEVDTTWLLGANPDWDNHYYVDARQEGWQSLLINTVIPKIIDKGFRGLFLDMVDTALPGLYPETKPGMVQLIRRIHDRYPNLRLIMNHGFFLVDDVDHLVDGVVAEGVFTRYDFEEEEYYRAPPVTRDSLMQNLDHLATYYGIAPFIVNYAGSDDTQLRSFARQKAENTGFPSFVSTIALDTVPRPASASASSSCLAETNSH